MCVIIYILNVVNESVLNSIAYFKCIDQLMHSKYFFIYFKYYIKFKSDLVSNLML